GNVAIAARKHANQNTFAMMRGRPLDMPTYLAGRVIGYPLTLYDCCLETDGALACVVTSVERARDLRQRAVLVHSVAQASGPNPVHLANYNNTPTMETTSVFCARQLWARSAIQPRDIHCAQIYDAFTPLVITGLEDYGFCKRGEGGPFTEGGRIEIGGALPVLTSGGGLSEAYVHGFNLILEGVRQIRGTSVNQVEGCQSVLVTGASGVATSAAVLRGEEGERMILAGDIGGTKTRLALYTLDGGRLVKGPEETYPSREHAKFDTLLAAFRGAHPDRIRAACFGVAGPVRGGNVRTTNLPWELDAHALASALGLARTWLVNDLEATAWGVTVLPDASLATLNAGTRDPQGSAAVIASDASGSTVKIGRAHV